MKKLILCLALAVCGCNGNSDGGGGGGGGGGGAGGGGSNAGGYAGTWKGDVAGWSVTTVVSDSTELGGSYYLQGSATTNKSNCLANGTLAGSITSAGKATLTITDSGNSSRLITVMGTISGNKLTGTFESQSDNSACITTSTAVTLTKQ